MQHLHSECMICCLAVQARANFFVTFDRTPDPSVRGAGPGPGNPVALLVSGRFRRLVSQVLSSAQECKTTPLPNLAIALIAAK
jgi:hypothetical protein